MWENAALFLDTIRQIILMESEHRSEYYILDNIYIEGRIIHLTRGSPELHQRTAIQACAATFSFLRIFTT